MCVIKTFYRNVSLSEFSENIEKDEFFLIENDAAYWKWQGNITGNSNNMLKLQMGIGQCAFVFMLCTGNTVYRLAIKNCLLQF